MMSITRILNGLECMNETGNDAVQAARLGFLEWAFCARDGGTPQAARAALGDPAAQNASSDAAKAFVAYLRDATRPVVARPRRRSRLLH
ncbi:MULTISPECIES: hypothetical protein [unclassified Roseovarius]|uniref:hypothetical protein n=1 Tax=unclassified Roseovarius TaxID=2614913 RepID=UPI00273F3A3F|nr:MULTISPECIES: hypothetical protein [unclassified Roseovarius]